MDSVISSFRGSLVVLSAQFNWTQKAVTHQTAAGENRWRNVVYESNHRN